jgi:hypothetical protein
MSTKTGMSRRGCSASRCPSFSLWGRELCTHRSNGVDAKGAILSPWQASLEADLWAIACHARPASLIMSRPCAGGARKGTCE